MLSVIYVTLKIMSKIEIIDVYWGYISLIGYRPDMVAKTIIAQYVKEMRKKYKLTQVDLSEKAGVGLRFVRELEQGKTTLRLDKVNKVFELFGSECGPVPMKREGDEV